jgi:hypothetical protein
VAKLLLAGETDDTIDNIELLEVISLISDGTEGDRGTLEISESEYIGPDQTRNCAGLIGIGEIAGLIGVRVGALATVTGVAFPVGRGAWDLLDSRGFRRIIG